MELADGLDDERADRVVAATPAWTVTDVYRHLAGSCDDVLAGRLDGVTTDPWTQAQVDARAARPLADVVSEWVALAREIDALLDSLGDAMDARFFIDAWTHEQDLRGTLGVPGGRDDSVVTDHLAGVVKGVCVRVRRAGLAPIEVRSGDAVNRSGDEPAIVLEVEPFELLRGTLGRRSRRQLMEWGWQQIGDAEPADYLDALMVFGMATADIDDAR